jgi:glycerol-3-phosphate dehydrogenase
MQIERVRSERFDLLVVGGGIIGAGVRSSLPGTVFPWP